MCEKKEHFLAWHPKNPNRNESGRIQLSKAVSKCPKMHVHTCSRAVPHLSTASVLPLGSSAQLFPSQHERVLCQCCSPRTSYLAAVICNSNNISPPISHSISHPIPARVHPQHTQTLALQPLQQGEQPPCRTALLSLKQIQCIQLLLEAVVKGETFQYAQQSLWGIKQLNTEVITTKHKRTAIFHRWTVLLNMSRFQRKN